MNRKYIDELIEKLVKVQANKTGSNHELIGEKELPFFYKVYPLSNEYLKDYFSLLDLKNKKVLTVGSSGDQILYAIACGAKEVSNVDINPYAKFYIDFKISAIKLLKYKEFKKFFDSETKDLNLIKSKLYSKIRNLMPNDSQYFWDNIFIEFDSLVDFTHLSRPVLDSYVYDAEQYYGIKEALDQGCKLTFKCLDIRNIFEYIKDEKYDAVFLSNIFDYVADWEEKSIENKEALKSYTPQEVEFFNICQGLLNSLNPNGILQVQYRYGDKSTMHAKRLFEKHFKNYKVSRILTIEGGPVIIHNTPNTQEKSDLVIQDRAEECQDLIMR